MENSKITTQTVTPFIWYNNNVKEAADFYASVFKDAKILGSNPMSATININGQTLILFNGGPHFKLNEAFSLSVNCETQEEIDALWEKLSAGGEKSRCGWLKDQFGLSWQIVPSVLPKLLSDPDPAKAKYAMDAMLKMNKIIIADLKRA